MKILITGVLGVIGSKLKAEFDKRGHKVFGVDLYDTNSNYGHFLGAKGGSEDYFRCDISKYRQLEYVVKYFRPDFIFNAAVTFGRWGGEQFYEQLWETNVIGVKNIIRLQEEYGFKLVHFSSNEIYGDYDGVMSEDVCDTHPLTQLNDYAISKRVNEIQILNSKRQFGTESVIIRPCNTYGPGEWFTPFRSVACCFCYNLLNNKEIKVYRGHKRNNTWLDDVVFCIANIADRFKAGEVYNIASADEICSIEELAAVCLKHTRANENLVKVIDSCEPMTVRVKNIDNSKAVRDLGFKTTITLDAGIEKTVEWMRKYYNL